MRGRAIDERRLWARERIVTPPKRGATAGVLSAGASGPDGSLDHVRMRAGDAGCQGIEKETFGEAKRLWRGVLEARRRPEVS
jgi:hypothetical protein